MSLAVDQKYRVYVPLRGIAPEVIRATLLKEDRFYDFHPGINPVAVLRAARQLVFGSAHRSGASTISMQVARLRYHLNTRTISGKLTQMWRAIEIERHFSKPQILEAYLNLAPYGGNIEGIETASEIYFGKPASNLTLPEAAALCVIPQSPARRAMRIGGAESCVDESAESWIARAAGSAGRGDGVHGHADQPEAVSGAAFYAGGFAFGDQ